jgi:hypothetical protein
MHNDRSQDLAYKLEFKTNVFIWDWTLGCEGQIYKFLSVDFASVLLQRKQ